jgi:hypothetical protein
VGGTYCEFEERRFPHAGVALYDKGSAQSPACSIKHGMNRVTFVVAAKHISRHGFGRLPCA